MLRSFSSLLPAGCDACSNFSVSRHVSSRRPSNVPSPTNGVQIACFVGAGPPFSGMYSGLRYSASAVWGVVVPCRVENGRAKWRNRAPFVPIFAKDSNSSKSKRNGVNQKRGVGVRKEILQQKVLDSPALLSESTPLNAAFEKEPLDMRVSSALPESSSSNKNDLGTTLPSKNPLSSFVGAQWRRLVRNLSSFPLAIGILFAVAGACALGTIIEQGQSPATYIQDYPEENPVLGFLTWRIILALSLDHVYSSTWFLLLLLLLGFSLAACTSSRQWPMVKVAQRWSFYRNKEPIMKLDVNDALPNGRISDLATLLSVDGYQVFQKDQSVYGFKGLTAKIAPIGVHAALLLIMIGGTFTTLGGYYGTAMIPQGIGAQFSEYLKPNGFLTIPSSAMRLRVFVNNFRIDYRPNGEVEQFYSDLSILNTRDEEILRKTISVNDPLRCQGVTIYQTDWSISALQVRLNDDQIFNLPFASLAAPGTNEKFYGTLLPLKNQGSSEERKGISFLARDFQTVAIYDSNGQFAGVRRPGSQKPIEVDGVKLVLDDLIGSTGLEMKMDPAVPLVYAGFGAAMITSCISFLSHSQVWALEEGDTLYVGGKSNRSKLTFEKDLNALLDAVPVVVAKGQEVREA